MGVANMKLKRADDDLASRSEPSSPYGHNRPKGPVEIDPASFPDQPTGHKGVLCTVDNVRHMLNENGVTVRYNVIKKRTEIDVPWLNRASENVDAVAMTHVQSLASRYGMPTGLVPQITEAIGEEQAYNPAADWIASRPWDGLDRIKDLCDTLVPREGYPLDLRNIVVRKWLLSVAAAATQPDFRCRGVLTLQGGQGIGKTSWGLSLVNDAKLRKELIKVDHHLDPSSKDSQLGAIDHLIVEVGELDSSLRRDVARLKGFISSPTDKIRRPYGRVTVEYPRRTVFYATVNASDFLVDDTGNVRWWTIPCASINHAHGIDMQQVFAQCAAMVRDGEIWWLTPEEERLLEGQNSQHRSASVVRDRVMAALDMESDPPGEWRSMTPSELLEHVGFDRPTNSQAKECAALLRELLGESKRIRGRNVWRVPLRTDGASSEAKPVTTPRSKFD